MPQKNLAVELLHKLLNDEIQHRSRRNIVQSRSFAAMLEDALRRYQNRAIQAAEVIEELIQLAKQMQEAKARGEELGLTDDEFAFYTALAANESAVEVLGNEMLMTIARELVEQVRRNTTIDWTLRESARAKLRVLVKRILAKYGYPPDKRDAATETVLEQAAVLSDEWSLEPSIEELQARYGALAYKKETGTISLAEVREMRDLQNEIGRLTGVAPERRERLLEAAEEKETAYDPGLS